MTVWLRAVWPRAVLCIQQSTAVKSATRCSSILESALQASSHVYTMQHKRMRQAIGCRPVPQLQTLWVNMIYIFVIYTNICVYNVFVYGGQWPNLLCIFTLHLSIRSLWASSASCACLFCACLFCVFLLSVFLSCVFLFWAKAAVCTTRFEEGLPTGRRGLPRC